VASKQHEEFEVGEEYLLFAGGGLMTSGSAPAEGGATIHPDQDPPLLWTSSCSRTRHFQYAEKDDLPALGKPTWVGARVKESLLSDELREASAAGDLVAAARQNDLALAQRLVAAGADPQKPPTEPPPLDIAVGKGNVEMTRLLLGKGARPTQTTLEAAVQSGSRGVVRLLDEPLRRWVGLVKPGPAALIGAAGNSNLAGIDLALESGVPVDATSDRGSTALLVAVTKASRMWSEDS
jgi:hypothetical protein